MAGIAELMERSRVNSPMQELPKKFVLSTMNAVAEATMDLMTQEMVKTMLVTGGSGSIASWAIVDLLKGGYTVRTKVRSLDKEPAVRAQIATAIEPENRLSFFAADLMSDEGWDAAVAGCDYVLHIAALVGIDAPRDPNVLIVPTRDGAVRVLRAACSRVARSRARETSLE